MMITMVGCILASTTSKVISSGDYDDNDGWLYHCLMPQQHLRSYRVVIMMITMVGCILASTTSKVISSGDYDDNDGWLYSCLSNI